MMHWFQQKKRSILHVQMRGSLAALLIAILVIASGAYYFAEKLLTNTSEQALRYHAETRIEQIERFIERQRSWLKKVVKSQAMRTISLKLIDYYNSGEIDSAKGQESIENFRFDFQVLVEAEGVEDLFIVNNSSELVFSLRPQDDEIGLDLSEAGFYGESIFSVLLEQISRDQQLHFSPFGDSELLNHSTILIGIPIYHPEESGQRIGSVIRPIAVDRLRSMIESFIGMGDTGEVVLGRLRGEGLSSGVNFISHFRNGLGRSPDAACRALRLREHGKFPMLRALQGEDGDGWLLDNSCYEVFSVWHWFDEVQWGMVLKQDKNEILAPAKSLQESIILFSLLVLLLLLVVVYRLSESLLNYERNLVKANQAKDEFLASMSHELRTPLTSIIGNSQCLLEEEHTANQHELLLDIESAGRTQLALVNDILDISKIESGKFTIENHPFELSTILGGIERMFNSIAHNAGLEFSVICEFKPSHQFIGDAQRITQVLTNLVGNALKFTHQGDITLRVRLQEGQLIFTVSDTGIGISREVRERLFKPFEQADSSISRRFGGSGLGLYISHNLTQMMGGKMELQSEEGKGSVFTVSLPSTTGDALQTTTPETAGGVESQTRFTGHVLVAEDTPELQLLERRILEQMGVQVTIAENGQQAVERVRSQQFDLVLMDMQMPVMDGIEACTLIKQMRETLPVFAVTANVMQKHRDAFHAAGCDGFLSKPIDKGALRRALTQHLPPATAQPERQTKPSIDSIQRTPERPALSPSTEDAPGVSGELKRLFIERLAPVREQLKVSIESGDQEVMAQSAKAVMGSARQFGYPDLSEQSEALYHLTLQGSREQQSEAASTLLHTLEMELQNIQ